MAITIFYSWQSDTPSKSNHRFIKDALDDAVKQLVEEGDVEEAPRVDHDTKDVHGDPDIFPTILKKIENCDVFIADVTIVASTSDGKNIPNPNVLLELGYAYKAVGSGRIIKIMNDTYGDPKMGLPFDLTHKRWPYVYSLAPDTEKPKREKIKELVAKDLANFVRLILENEGAKSEATMFDHVKVAFDKLQMGKTVNYNEQLKEKEAEILRLKNELEQRRQEVNWGETIRNGADPLSVWFKRTIKGNPNYILSASRKELEILVANTFAEEQSPAFILNAKNMGMVDDKLRLTERGFKNLIAAAKALSTP